MPGSAAACVCLGLAAATAYAQIALVQPKDALREIVKQYALPNCPDADQLRTAKDIDAEWLFSRFESTGWDKIDSMYAASLNDLLDGLQRAAKDRNTAEACATVRVVIQDLHVKRIDCEKLGHSRRDVPVRIRTVRGNNEVKDWEVYTRWLPAGDRFTTTPKRLRGLSSPAQGTVPIPGEFEIYAQDPSSGAKSEIVRVSIGGTETFEWTIPLALRAK